MPMIRPVLVLSCLLLASHGQPVHARDTQAAVRVPIGSAQGSNDRSALEGAQVVVEGVVTGNFEPRYLDVPKEALISTMQGNQRYFPLLDEAGELLPTRQEFAAVWHYLAAFSQNGLLSEELGCLSLAATGACQCIQYQATF